jgi:transcriptional regulator with XRE-family HTH domain
MQSECNLRERLGERLKQARARLDLTQKELCFLAGLPLQSLKDYEGGKRLPGAEALCAYASAGVRVDWLLTGDGPMLQADVAQPAAPAAPPTFDEAALTKVISLVIDNARSGETAENRARMVIEFYSRLMAMREAKPEAA